MLSCPKCLCGRSEYKQTGEKCLTPGCDGVVAEPPAFSTLVDTLPEPQTCGRRMRDFGSWERVEGLDRWEQFKSNGDRVCSFCGSLHPDDFMRLVKECAEAPDDAVYGTVPEIEPSDKGYKIYVHRSGVRNAHEGGIKFYTQHLPRDAEGNLAVTEAQQDDYRRAQRATARRFDVHLGRIRYA